MFSDLEPKLVRVRRRLQDVLPCCAQVFLGTLRDIEVEMIKDRLSSAVMESLLALTVFREEFGTFFVAMFASLVFVKVLHWLVQNRVEFIEVTLSCGPA